MSASAKRFCLELTRLDQRNVPSTVNAVTTARPFDFVGSGTLLATTIDSSGSVPLTTSSNTAVTINGELDYTNNTSGSANLVGISGTGTGTQTAVNPTTGGGRGTFAQTLQGQLGLADADGNITTPTPITGTENWLTPSSATGIDLIGPQTATGTFDVSTFKLQAGWTGANSSSGTLAVTLAPKTNTPTDLSFSDTAAVIAPDGTVTLDFTANVSGNPMQAASEDIAATSVSGVWEGGGQTQATDLNIPIYWNTGSVAAHVTGLTPPSWATKLIVKIDARNAVGEGNETNNTWSVTMSDLVPPVPPSPPPPPPAVASYVLVPGVEALLQWRTAEGAVLAQAPAIDGYTGPVSIASGDVNGDGISDVVVAAGEGGGPRIRVMDGKTGAVLSDFFAFDPTFRGGTNIALGDLNGDGKMELIAGAGSSGGPQVTVFDPVSGAAVRSFFAYDPTARGGVSVAAADVDGDGKDEIITTPGAGEDPTMLVIDGISNVEKFQAPLTGVPANEGVAVTSSVDAATGASVVTATDDDGTVLAKFRSQLAASEPLLVPLPTGPILMNPS